jgi:predicted alpha/beta hydrolase
MVTGNVCCACNPETGDIPAADGFPLAATIYGQMQPRSQKVAIMMPAMGVRRERYAEFARFLANRSWTVVTFDYRGIGGSQRQSLKQSAARLFDWGEKDLAGVIDWVFCECSPRRCVAVGHSVGGQILGLAPNCSKLSAVLMIACQKGYTEHWDGVWKYVVRSFWWSVPPLTRIFGCLPMGLAGCENLPPYVAADWRRWAMHPDFVDECWRSSNERFRNYRSSILSISFDDDRLFAPARAVRALLELYPCARSEHWHIDPMDLGVRHVGHSGFFDAGLCPGLWETTAQWLEEAL